ncbi:hypothetical protein AVCANL279_07365 [Campylobacter canadensis]|uniref:hypothetical protein n=1 Tax=Campylobacter canadensis TaxID=449520 RepID=UPI001CCDB08B|nr:hypothetical protein [Campylobacter canadensis]MBZ7997137.1 hypothetical protein [Campylobacter canadensis]
MQREVVTKAKKLKLKNPFFKETINVENNLVKLRVDEFYTDEFNNVYYCYDGNGTFTTFDNYINIPLFNINSLDFFLVDKELLKENSSYLLLFNDEIDDKYKKDLEEFLLERISNDK